jgi:hypothetical protein
MNSQAKEVPMIFGPAATHHSNNDVAAYAEKKGIAPGTLLWASDVPLTEDAFRSGAKNAASVDFLRWQDIDMEDTKGRGRIPPEEWGHFAVNVGQGISLFVKRMIPESAVYLGDSLEKAKVKELKSDFDPVEERKQRRSWESSSTRCS